MDTKGVSKLMEPNESATALNIEFVKYLLDQCKKTSAAFDAKPNEDTGFNKNLALAALGSYSIPIIEAYVAAKEKESDS